MSRVLVVDDSWVVRHHLQSYLAQDGHEVVLAEEGEGALQIIADSRVDLVFLDMLMPGISGIEVLERLADQRDAPPVVVLTADIQDSTRKRVKELGASQFLSKPPSADDVQAAARLLARKR